jgi:hypothetical protein
MSTRRRTIIRRRRGFWALAVVLFALLIRAAVEHDGLACVGGALAIVCWFGLYRTWVDGGLR